MPGHRDEPRTEGVLVPVEAAEVADDGHPGLGRDVVARVGAAEDVQVAQEQRLRAAKQPGKSVRVARTRADQYSSELGCWHHLGCRRGGERSVTGMCPWLPDVRGLYPNADLRVPLGARSSGDR